MKEKIEQRVIGLFVLMVAILVFVSISAVSTIESARRSSDWVNKTHSFMIEVNQVLASLHEGDSAMRAYLLTGDVRDQAAYRAAYGAQHMLYHLANAEAMTRKGEEQELQHTRIIELQNLISNRINFVRSVVLARNEHGLDAARQLMSSHPDVEDMDKIDFLVQSIIDEENSLLKTRDQDYRAKAQGTKIAVYTGAGVNLILLLFIIWLMRDDLAARRLAAIVLQEANATLETKVMERTAELQKSNETLKKENLERRWSNQALDHQLRYSALIINSINELVFVISRALNISRINPAVSHHTHFEPQDLIAQPLDRVLKLQAEGSSGSGPENPISFAMRQGREIQDRNGVILSKSGQGLPVRYSMFPLRDQDKVVGAVITVRVNGAPH